MAAPLFSQFENGAIFDSKVHKFQIEDVVTEGIKRPWSMAFLPEGGFLVADKEGQLLHFAEGSEMGTELTNLPKVESMGQGGLMDLELHPDYVKNGWVYISYTKAEKEGSKNSMTCLIRAKINKRKMALTDIETIFEITEPDHFSRGGRHFGTRTVFDSDGYLYLAFGDRGQQDKSQDLSLPHGHIFRMYDDGRVPNDNPFFGQKDVYEATWTYGHRNPQGMVIHPATGELWAIEHGPKGGDELNLIEKGKNYGWPVITFGINYNGTPITDETHRPGMEQPVKYWVPSPAPCGMAVYSGDKFPKWKNQFFIANLRHKKVIRLELDKNNRVVDEEILLEGVGRLRDIETGPDGNLWVLAETTGRIFKLVPVE